MKDNEFKLLGHSSKGYSPFSHGCQIEKNYSPDFTLIKKNDYILLEHESEPNRKTIVADMFKAAHFLQGSKTGILVVVMTPKGKSSLESYPKHIQVYLNWIADKSNLKTVYFISETEYASNGQCISIDSDTFKKVALKIKSNS